eukprot:scaffold78194_cov69-Phaeocystis_antarctica.AAC.1
MVLDWRPPLEASCRRAREDQAKTAELSHYPHPGGWRVARAPWADKALKLRAASGPTPIAYRVTWALPATPQARNSKRLTSRFLQVAVPARCTQSRAVERSAGIARE